METVGVLGLGVMGSAIAQRLLAELGVVHISSRRPEAGDKLRALGSAWHNDAASLGAACSVLIVSANTAQQVEDAVFGECGALSAATEVELVIDMSTISPEATREMASRAKARNVGWVDSPLSGGAPKAGVGELTLFLGGEEHDVARAHPVLSKLATRMAHCGPSGAGQTVKIINQILVGIGFFALSEAATLSIAAGLNPAVIRDALQGGRADSALLREFFVKFATHDYSPTGRISNMAKDFRNARDLAESLGVVLPFTSLGLDFNRWLEARGYADADVAATMALYGERRL